MKPAAAAVALIFSLLLASVICAPLLRLRSGAGAAPEERPGYSEAAGEPEAAENGGYGA